MSEQESNTIESLKYQVIQWRTLVTKYLPETRCDRDDVEAISSVIEELTARVKELETDIGKMNGCRSCKVCGQDYAIAEIAERMGFRPDVGALEIRKLQAVVDRLADDWITNSDENKASKFDLRCEIHARIEYAAKHATEQSE